MTTTLDRDSLVRQGYEFSAPPQNIEAEEAILGGILLDPLALPRVKDKLTPDAFYLENHRAIYKGCLECSNRDGVVDLMTICTYLQEKKQLDKIGGQSKLAQLVEIVVSTVNIDRYVELVNEKYLRRQLIELGRDAHYCGHETLKRLDESFSYLKEKATELQSLVGGKDRNYSRYQQAIQEFEHLEMNIEDSGFRHWEKSRLCRKYADVGIKSVKELENLWFSYMSSQEDEGFKSIQEIFNTVPPQREWFLHGLLPAQSLVTIHGPGGCGKSTLVYDFIYSLVTGTPWGRDSFNEGFSTTASQRKTMLIQTDETMGEMVSAFHRRGLTEDMPILLKMKWSIDKIPQLLKKAQEYRPDVIIIDCLTSVSAYSLFSENDVEYARPVLRLRKLAEQMNCCIILIHHSNKAGGLRGTTAIQNSSSEVISLEPNPDDKNPDSTKRLLVFNKSRSRRPVSYELELTPDTGTWTCLGEHKKHEDAALTTTKNKIIRFLRSRPNVRFEVTEMQNEFGGSTGNIRTCCAELARDGLISKFSPGRGLANLYFIASADRPPDQPPDRPPDRPKEPLQGGGLSILAAGASAKSGTSNYEDAANLGDRPIAPLEAKTETLVSQSVQEAEGVDRGGRSEVDRAVEVEVQPTAPQQVESAIAKSGSSVRKASTDMANKEVLSTSIRPDEMMTFTGEQSVSSTIYIKGKLRADVITPGMTVIPVKEIFHSDQSQIYVRPIKTEWDERCGIAVPKDSLELANPLTVASIVLFKERIDGWKGLLEVTKVDGINIEVKSLATGKMAVVEIREIDIAYRCPKPFRFQIDEYIATFHPVRLDRYGNVSTTIVEARLLDTNGEVAEIVGEAKLSEGSPTNLKKWFKEWVENHE